MTPRAARHRTRLTALGALAALLGAGCGTDHAGGGHDAAPHGTRVSTPAPTGGPVPAGQGGTLPGDVNGDGHPDLRIPVPGDRIVYVLGSPHGLDPDTRIVLDDAVGSVTADLDGDGFPELVTPRADDRSVTGPDGIRYSYRTLLHVQWGGPRGPDGARTLLRLPGAWAEQGIGSRAAPAVGDFDGDGHQDLAVLRIDGAQLLLLHGPFSRDGRPASSATRTVDTGGDGFLVADAVSPEGDRPTDLLVQRGTDGGQSRNLLFAASSAGLARQPRELRAGSSTAFGDFDGDGRRDLAIGDSGSRNDEPGYQTEAPEVSGSVNVYYGGTSGPPRHIRVPGIEGGMVAADTDGDGRSALAVDRGVHGARLLTLEPDSVTDRGTLHRDTPARYEGRKLQPHERGALLHDAADFDGDGRDEVVLQWGSRVYAGDAGEPGPSRWWITDGARDLLVFTARPYAE